jgi:hypothetical protein
MLKKLGYAALVAVAAAAFIVGSAATGEAKGKKKAAAPPPPPPVICLFDYKPVCGVKGKTKSTWANACFAAKNGAKVAYQGACKVHKAKAKKKAAKKPAMKKKPAPKKKAAMKKPAAKKMKQHAAHHRAH